jgi:hypothetical protein
METKRPKRTFGAGSVVVERHVSTVLVGPRGMVASAYSAAVYVAGPTLVMGHVQALGWDRDWLPVGILRDNDAFLV